MPRPTLFEHPKFHRLVHELKLPRPYVLGLLEFLWRPGYASGNPIIGDAIDVELVAEWPGTPNALVTELEKLRFIDRLEDGRYQIHDLFDHAPEYVSERRKRENERKVDKTCAFCSEIYRNSDPRSTYCSSKCRSAAWRKSNCDGNDTENHGKNEPSAGDGTQTENHGALTPARARALKEEEIHLAAQDVCSEPIKASAAEPMAAGESQESSKVVMSFPVVGKKPNSGLTEWPLTEAKVAEYQESFPGVDVMVECRKARQWCIDNPTKRKTVRGMPKFLSGWLARQQDRGSTPALQVQATPKPQGPNGPAPAGRFLTPDEEKHYSGKLDENTQLPYWKICTWPGYKEKCTWPWCVEQRRKLAEENQKRDVA
jgi:hypothetical protein